MVSVIERFHCIYLFISFQPYSKTNMSLCKNKKFQAIRLSKITQNQNSVTWKKGYIGDIISEKKTWWTKHMNFQKEAINQSRHCSLIVKFVLIYCCWHFGRKVDPRPKEKILTCKSHGKMKILRNIANLLEVELPNLAWPIQ